MTNRSRLLDTLRSRSESVDARLLSVIQDPSTREVDFERTSGTTVKSVISLWTVRWIINRDTDHPLIGAEELLQLLATRAPQSKVRQMSLVGREYICTLFFEGTSDDFVGSLIIRRRSDQEEAARLERFSALTGQLPVESAA